MHFQTYSLSFASVFLLTASSLAQFNFGPRVTHLDVGRPGEWNDHDVLNPVVLETEVFTGSPYTMYYTGHGGPVGHPLEEYVVGVAHSPDGVSWTKSVTAVLGWGSAGDWDERGMIWHTVVEDPTATPARFRMYYAASAADGKTRIGLAFSSDGKTFSKFTFNPILDVGPPGTWDAGSVFGCSVLSPFAPPHPTWRMWYTGFSDRRTVAGATGGIGTAWSPDGITWFKDPLPMPTWSGSSLAGAYFFQPVVRFIEGAYHMWMSRCTTRTPWTIAPFSMPSLPTVLACGKAHTTATESCAGAPNPARCGTPPVTRYACGS